MVAVVEWADKALVVLPLYFRMVTLTLEGDTERLIRLEPRGERYERLVLQVKDELSKRRSSIRRK